MPAAYLWYLTRLLGFQPCSLNTPYTFGGLWSGINPIEIQKVKQRLKVFEAKTRAGGKEVEFVKFLCGDISIWIEILLFQSNFIIHK